MLRSFSILYLLLPLTAGYPSYVECADDNETMLQVGGQKIMTGPAVQAPASVTMEVLRNGNPVTSYIEGEMLLLHVEGIDAGTMAALRSSSPSNSTLYTKDYSSATTGLWKSKCANQVYNPQPKTLTGSTYVAFRPGCINSNKALQLSLGGSTSFSAPVLLSTVQLTSEGKQDASCNGGPLPAFPLLPETPGDIAAAISRYNALVWVHRWCVICSWGFLFPLGVTLVRFYPSGSRLSLHRIIQTLGLLVEVVSFTCIVIAHGIGPDGTGPSEANFSGAQGSSPGLSHPLRGLILDICVVLQVIFGLFRPKPFPNTFRRRVWLWLHRSIGDGAIVVAWLQIWESISTLPNQSTLEALSITSCLFVASAALVLPVYFMLVASKSDINFESMSIVESAAPSVLSRQQSPAVVDDDDDDNQHPRDATFFGCGYCNQVFTSKHILTIHIKFSHPDMEYCEIRTPMTQRFAEVTNNASLSEGIPLSEVKQHNTKLDCWCVINGKVYDLTNFLSKHPGGPDPILSWAGRDASRTWNLIHKKSWLESYPLVCLGALAPEPPVEGLLDTTGVHRRAKATADSSAASTSMTDMQTGLVSHAAQALNNN